MYLWKPFQAFLFKWLNASSYRPGNFNRIVVERVRIHCTRSKPKASVRMYTLQHDNSSRAEKMEIQELINQAPFLLLTVHFQMAKYWFWLIYYHQIETNQWERRIPRVWSALILIAFCTSYTFPLFVLLLLVVFALVLFFSLSDKRKESLWGSFITFTHALNYLHVVRRTNLLLLHEDWWNIEQTGATFSLLYQRNDCSFWQFFFGK